MAVQPRQPLVLVIDPDQWVLELIRELLEEEGYRVSTHACPPPDRDTIARLQPSLIIIDHFGPGLTAGWSFVQLLKRHHDTSAIPVVLCTGAHRQVEALESRLEAMDVAVVPKPFDIEQFLAMVKSALTSPVAA